MYALLMADEAAAAMTYGWILDIVFFALLIGGAAFGSKLGLIRGVCRIAGWLLSILLPFLFCMQLAEALQSWFGLTAIISEGIGGNQTLAEWITIGISFVGLFIVIRLGTWLVGKIGTSLTESCRPFAVINHLLGGVLGLFEAFCIVIVLLLICTWLNIESVNAFINTSYVVSAIYRSDFLAQIPGMITQVVPVPSNP